jgi:hypothetical protein
MITDTIPDEFQLKLQVFHDLLDKEGDWSFIFNIDKSSISQDSITITPDISKNISVSNDSQEENYNITVKRVNISPFGAQMIIETDVSDFVDFAIRDERGAYFPLIYNGGITEGLNTLEFICLNDSFLKLNLIPIAWNGKIEKVYEFTSEYGSPSKIELSKLGGYTVEKISYDNNEFKIEFKQYGIVLPDKSIINNALAVIDEDGNDVIKFGNPDYNKETGTIILSSLYEGTEEELKEKIKGFRHIYISNIVLEEEQAITINIK